MDGGACFWPHVPFPDSQALVNGLLREAAGERDIALYVDNPHVVLESGTPESVSGSV